MFYLRHRPEIIGAYLPFVDGAGGKIFALLMTWFPITTRALATATAPAMKMNVLKLRPMIIKSLIFKSTGSGAVSDSKPILTFSSMQKKLRYCIV
jgi:hypothetical protein